jgi:hypothetical protein
VALPLVVSVVAVPPFAVGLALGSDLTTFRASDHDLWATKSWRGFEAKTGRSKVSASNPPENELLQFLRSSLVQGLYVRLFCFR